jgi:hypothetical protein
MKPILLVLLSVLSFPSALVFADIGESLGRDLVRRSLNKKIIITPHRSWTEHRAGDTGIDIIIVPCPPEPKKLKKESARHYKERLREYTIQSTRCR